MKKTHSANIGGTVFQIEEEAYEILQNYLHSIETHFHFYPDVKDIVADIEGRIAEQLLQREMTPQVVRLADVERVIDAMGRIEQFGDPDAEQAPHGKARKLFRDMDQKVVAGVAAGLASYLGLPTLLVRLAFLLLLALFGISAVVYLLLWVLVPVASTTTDKLQMRGRPLTLASIDQGVRDGIVSIPFATRSLASRGVFAAGSLVHLLVVTIARAVKWAAGVLVVGMATTFVLIFTVALVVALVNANALAPRPFIADFFAAFGAWQHALKVFIYLLVAIPLALIIATALRQFWGVRRLNTRGLAGLLGVWVVALLATAAVWSSRYAELHRYMDEYPSMSEARHFVDRYRIVAATASPLSDAQAAALLATLIPEAKRRAEEDRMRFYPYGDEDSQLEWEEQRIKSRQASDRRIIESARSYLDERQLAVMQEDMALYTTRTQAALNLRRERLENNWERSWR